MSKENPYLSIPPNARPAEGARLPANSGTGFRRQDETGRHLSKPAGPLGPHWKLVRFARASRTTASLTGTFSPSSAAIVSSLPVPIP